ncbi:acyltransferase-like protein [Acinetobacter calcoaceticus]|uniref:Acyltransferase-like protein n=1 Tax=Acinetobacter calcoaceticus TaxID=471 RepID=A0A4R1XAK1_ACICA|nr:acyltransferase-like protein [Acinetobacter calcoaceticus]
MKKLSRWHLNLAKLMTGFYYADIHVIGEKSTQPTLFIGSHRNGATDGQVYTWALGDTPSLVSIQMLRKWFLRLIFDGIPVVREVDTQRYNIDPHAVAAPIAAAVQQLQAGGSLSLMPEGSSEWSYQAMPYKKGMAKIIQQLQQQQQDIHVQAVGVFYSKPDGFRSRVMIVLGEAFIPRHGNEDEIFTELSQQLNQVAVNCDSVAHFNHCQQHAWTQHRQQENNYAAAFLATQQQALPSNTSINPAKQRFNPWQVICKWIFRLAFLPTVSAARLAQQGADGRNNITFFRLLGGLYGSVLTLLYWLLLCWLSPIWGAVLIMLGWLSWYFYPEPTPEPLSTPQSKL